MKFIYLLLFSFMLSGCTAFSFSPTGYIERQECSIGEVLSFNKPECYGGYSSTVISENKFLVTFEGNEYTTLQRATDLAIMHCTEIALNTGFAFISIDIAERNMVTSVSASNGGASTSIYPMASTYCNISDTKTDNNIEAAVLNLQLKTKYQVQN